MAEVKLMIEPSPAPSISTETKPIIQRPSLSEERVQLPKATKEDEATEGEDSCLQVMQTSSDSGCGDGDVDGPLRLIMNKDESMTIDHSEEKLDCGESIKPQPETNCINGDHKELIEHQPHENGETSSPPQPEPEAPTASSALAALAELGNNIKTESPLTALPKKSNLKRRVNQTDSSDLIDLKPKRKRIRIVENLDAVNQNNYINLEDNSPISEDTFPGVDVSATVSENVSCSETLTWLNSPSSQIDQTLVHAGFVRANLSPVKRNFSVEPDMRFVLTDTINSIVACKNNVGIIGPFKIHQWIAQNCLHNHPKLKFVYKENFIKLANLDALLNFDLTSPKELISSGQGLQNDVYFVGDLYQKSKGFREYLLWRTSQNQQFFSTKVLGIQSLGPCSSEKDIFSKAGLLLSTKNKTSELRNNLAHLPVEMVEEFEPRRATNILDVGVINEFVEFIRSRTGGKGLHLFVADNSEVSYVYETCREVRFQKQFYSECLIALRCLREGGTFVCKIFDSITLFTNGLLFLMYKCFKSITVHKPLSSPLHTAERFLICKGKIENQDTKYVTDFLSDCLDMVVNNQEQRKIIRRRVRKRLAILKMEVQVLVPLKLILSHAEYFQFIRMNNLRLSTQLIQCMETLCILMESKDVEEKSISSSIGDEHLTKFSCWNLSPDQIQRYLDLYDSKSISEAVPDPIELCKAFLSKHGILEGSLSMKEVQLEETIDALIKLKSSNLSDSSSNSFIAVPMFCHRKRTVFNSQHGLFFGCGDSKLLYFDQTSSSWKMVDYPEFSIPRGSLLIGEIVEELHQNKLTRCFHLFDGIFVCGAYIAGYPIEQRNEILSRFIRCLRNPSRMLNLNLSVTHPLRFNELSSFYKTTCTKDSVIGYQGPSVRFYRINCSEDENRDQWGIMRAFRIFRNVQEPSAKEFLEKTESFVWHWSETGVDLGSELDKLEGL